MRRLIVALLAIGMALLVMACDHKEVVVVPDATVTVVPTTASIPTPTPSVEPSTTPVQPPPTATNAPAPTSTSAPPPPTVTAVPAATSTSVPVPTSTPTPVGKPKQRIRVTDPRNNEHESTNSIQIETNQTPANFDLDPVALDTGLPVRVATAPGSSCSLLDGEPGEVAFLGGAGDFCTMIFMVEETSDFAATEVTVEILFVPRLVSWTLESGPPMTGCYTPGTKVPDMVYRAVGSTPTLDELQIQGAYYTDPNGARGFAGFDQVEQSEIRTDSSRVTFAISIAPDVAVGSQIEVNIGYVSQGTSLVAFDEPDRFVWRIESSCP